MNKENIIDLNIGIILIILFLNTPIFAIQNQKTLNQNNFIIQSAREIPIVKSVDVVIIGGTLSAVAAAVSAKKNGATVFLIESKPYLGEDLCATFRLKQEPDILPKTNLERKIFDESGTTTPMRVKGVLSEELIKADVEFVYGSYVTDVIWNDDNKPAGIIIANRAGRQAVVAKTIIDASEHATVCKLAGAKFQSFTENTLEFERIIVLPGETEDNPIYEKTNLRLPMPDLSYPSFAKAEQLARKKTYNKEQLRASESLFFIPPNPVICNKAPQEWDTSSELTGHFQPEGFSNLFVLSGFAAIPDNIKEKLLKPGAMAFIGESIGKEAASLALKIPVSKELKIKANRITDKSGDIKEVLNGLRSVKNNQNTTIKNPKTGIPVLGDYDVVVIGGGTTGAPAAIAAGRWGMKVLVVEYLEGLGGIGTLGLIGKPWHGKEIGFAAEVPFPEGNAEPKMEWYRSEIEKAGCEIWLEALGCGAYTENNIVKGAVVCTPQGRGIVKAKVIIDATGSAEVAIAAGADYMYGGIKDNYIALQGTGFSSRPLNGNYYNSDYLLVDESDMTDVWRSLVSVHITKASENMYDAVPIIQNRERKRIVGDYILNYLDQVAGRTFPDVIVISSSSYDSHGYPSSPYFAMLPHDSISRKLNQPAPGGTCFTPYRCLLPKNLDGILVTGLGISMERDASAMVRMQLDLANQGYAAGVAAMLAITNDALPRNINIKELQTILVEKGNVPDSVLHLEDSFPLPDKKIYQAIKEYGKSTNPESAGKPLAIILSHKEKALSLLKTEYNKSTGRSKLLYAQVLGMCGEKVAVPTLVAELNNFWGWDEKIYQGSMADFAHLPTPIDALILAVGYSGDKTVLPLLLDLTDKLDSSVTLSHHRSLALALEKIADPSAARSLANLLQKPGMQGHAMLNINDALTELDNNGKGPNPVKNSSYPKRTRALREIILARALYKCGDYNDIGKNILETYKKDMRGLFVRHANQILKTG